MFWSTFFHLSRPRNFDVLSALSDFLDSQRFEGSSLELGESLMLGGVLLFLVPKLDAKEGHHGDRSGWVDYNPHKHITETLVRSDAKQELEPARTNMKYRE